MTIFASRAVPGGNTAPVNRALEHTRMTVEPFMPGTENHRLLLNIQRSLMRSHLDEHAGNIGYLRLTEETVQMLEHALAVIGRILRVIYNER